MSIASVSLSSINIKLSGAASLTSNLHSDHWSCDLLLTLDNKDLNQVSEVSGFHEKHGFGGVPILAGSQIWFMSLLSKDFLNLHDKAAFP